MPKKLSLTKMRQVLKAAQRTYGKRQGIVGLGIGTKYKHREMTTEHCSLQFYVVEKKEEIFLNKQKLPKFVYSRNNSGKVDHSRKIPTDVIEVGKITPSCGGGDKITSLNERGVLSLLFHNKHQSDLGSRYLLTCAHVAGFLGKSPPEPNWLRSKCEPNHGEHFAETRVSSLPNSGCLEFDIALAAISKNVPQQPDCGVSGETNVRLRRAMTRNQISLPLKVSCALPASGIKTASIISFLSSVTVEYKKIGFLKVKNAFLINARVVSGDSGGLLYKGDQAVGIVFARSDRGFGWCHLISEAIDFLNRIPNIQLKIF